MNDGPGRPPEAGDAPPSPFERLKERLRGILRPRPADEALREAIEEIIEETDAPPQAIAAEERTLIGNVLKLRQLTAYDVMVPRVDIVAVDAAISLDELVKVLQREAHSRMPVYRGNLDEAIGMLHVKDVLRFWGSAEPFKIEDVLRKVLFVAPSVRVLDLLLDMRRARTHMALVVDEYGGIDGLVTIEDLVEEIVGEIEDEHDEEESPMLVADGQDAWTVDARLTLETFEAEIAPIMTAEERAEDIDTIGGLVTALAGRVPSRGEVLRHPGGFEFQVLDADPRRLKRLRVRRAPAPAAGDSVAA